MLVEPAAPVDPPVPVGAPPAVAPEADEPDELSGEAFARMYSLPEPVLADALEEAEAGCRQPVNVMVFSIFVVS
jgi:hypothetical protein